jgi:hypothetical protein
MDAAFLEVGRTMALLAAGVNRMEVDDAHATRVADEIVALVSDGLSERPAASGRAPQQRADRGRGAHLAGRGVRPQTVFRARPSRFDANGDGVNDIAIMGTHSLTTAGYEQSDKVYVIVFLAGN